MSFKQLRRVRDHIDEFKEEDHNDHVDNWKTQLGKLSEISSKLSDPPELTDLITRLKSVVNSMRKVKAGDFYTADDHNKFVDAWELQTEINDLIIRYFPFREILSEINGVVEILDVKGPSPLTLSASPVGVSTEKRVVLGSSVDVVSVGGEAIMPIPATPSRINIHEVVASIGTEVGT